MNILVTSFHFDSPIWHGIVLAVLLGAVLYIIWSPLQKILAHYNLQRLIGRLGHDSLRHITIMDGADVPLYIEYLILQADGLLLLNVKHFRGNIFAANNIETWTQVIRHHSFKFSNPLHELETNLQALRGLLPKINIRGRVVFTQGAAFPKGKPDAVCNIDELRNMVSETRDGEIPESIRQAWTQVGEAVQQDKYFHPSIFYQKGDKPRLFFGTLLFIGCLLYFGYVMGWLQGLG